jgi:hypothetical protein
VDVAIHILNPIHRLIICHALKRCAIFWFCHRVNVGIFKFIELPLIGMIREFNRGSLVAVGVAINIRLIAHIIIGNIINKFNAFRGSA